ncbi:Heterokaryon incompatibility protein [Madurella fahalii]|uniref:Heterokaryon incompatibility protein n=1 Tax=Madurella fahalii TaxID=1157608 RepID=A0ABQ0G2B7_9PEZI
MNGELTKARSRRSRATPTTAVTKLLAAAAVEGAEILRVRSPVNEGLVRDATCEQTAKRELNATSELPTKRTRLSDAQRLGAEEVKRADKTTRRHPKPKPPKRRDTSLPEPKVEKQEQVSPTTQLQKRQIDSGGDDNGYQLKRARLTRKNLGFFNKMARKGTKRGSAYASAPRDSTVDSSPTKTTSTTTSGFAIQLSKNRVLHPLYSKPPTNLADIRERYNLPRKTASPTESVYNDYANTIGGVPNEATMVVEMSGQLLKKYDDKNYKRAFKQAFTAFPKDVGFNNGLSAPQPDFIESLRMQEYRPFPVDDHIQGAVLYKDNPLSLTLPHIAAEWKGRGKDMEEARLQSAYDGAALVYARNQALAYLGKPDPPGHAAVTTFTTDGTNLNQFAHYAAQSEDGTLEYHQHLVRSTNLIESRQGFRDGRRGFRNAQDHAREQSYALSNQLKEYWKQRHGSLQPIAQGAPLPDLDDVPEEPLPAQESISCPDDGEVKEPPPLAKSTRHKHTSKKAPPACLTDNESGYEIIDKPSYAPVPPQSSRKLRRSTRLLNARQLSSDNSGNTAARKYKSSSRRKPETKAECWKWDAKRRRYFRQHVDGAVASAEDGFSG